ncbi:cryptochrome/photolyase family protein [Pseudomaricurvus sp.]|uniref:cryptochrome/photolyase family protein n=1 Tax=Pseudomaricurvus sp. TaxID=2004510 RepID=UPI003F6C5059
MMLAKNYQTVRLILGDQLNAQHSWFDRPDDSVLYLIAELKQEASYVKHHIQKLCAFFSAMEIFAKELSEKGHHVLHLTLDDTAQFKKLEDLIASTVKRFSAKVFQYQRPDEYRLLQQLNALKLADTINVFCVDSEHFLVPFEDMSGYVKPKQHNRMETFYRKMRKRFSLLMNGDQPLGGKWNYDGDNREKIKPKDLQDIPQPLLFSNDVDDKLERINKHNVITFGRCDDNLLWPVSRDQSLQLLKHFCEYCLPLFGRFQDAMTCQHPDQWTLYHSRLSFAMNSKILSPQEVIAAAVDAYKQSDGLITLPQIEGFVRQILGWREYVRCVYWVNMPHYSQSNHLDAQRNLPEYFWDGNTKMNCMKQAIDQSLTYAYAHHIQRLMITGNFCLLTGIHPDQVDAWYLGIYIDAIEWVEMPNTRGMSQFADGGWIATKPYSAGGNYVNKMSDYCKSCHYKVKEKSSENACPLNSLYWNFMNQHRDRLANNPRIGMVYRSWDRQSQESQQATLARANWCLENLEEL